MARLNLNPPQSVRSETVDSLYEGRSNQEHSPAPRESPSGTSDKENRRATSNAPSKAGRSVSGMNPPTSKVPLRNSNANNKRRRLDESQDRSSRAGSIVSECPVAKLNSQFGVQEVKEEGQQWFDPDQKEAYRAGLRIAMRDNHKTINENRPEYFTGDNKKLIQSLRKSDTLMNQVRMPSDAVVDSRYLLGVAELAQKKIAEEARGKHSRGIDIEEFIVQAIKYMKDEEIAADPERRRQTQTQSEEVDQYDVEETGDALPWAIFGENAAIPSNGRPAVASFLLGPLSVQKKIRHTQASARQRRDPIAAQRQPQDVDLAKQEKSHVANLVELCEEIRKNLEKTIVDISQAIDDQCSDDTTDAERESIHRRHGLTMDYEISLFQYALNPHSFAQSVENLFYISFLMKEGRIGLTQDEDGLPVIMFVPDEEAKQKNLQNIPKNQAIFSLDYDSWTKLVRAFDLKESIIPHREVTEISMRPGQWYT